MIALTKQKKPRILERNGDDWARIIRNKLSAGEELTQTEKTRYSHREIKEALVSETHGKCAYCESVVLHVDFGDIEHIAPKILHPEGWVDWNNLAFACRKCNRAKGTFDATTLNFVDPYCCDPEQRFMWSGAFIWGLPTDAAARATARLLELNRPALVEKRREKLEALMTLAVSIAGIEDPTTREVLLMDFEKETASNKEYAAVARSVLGELKKHLQDPS